METNIKQIDVPAEWQSENDWNSHLPALYLALTKGEFTVVTEFGSGDGSTPRLKKYCDESNIRLVSFETNPEYKEKYDYVTLIDDYRDIIPSPEDLDNLIFIDCAPGELRKELIERFADCADVIVVHDTESGASFAYPGVEDALLKFQYRLNYQPEGFPATTIVSNYIEVNKWL